jgi:hypothetical protein
VDEEEEEEEEDYDPNRQAFSKMSILNVPLLN